MIAPLSPWKLCEMTTCNEPLRQRTAPVEDGAMVEVGDRGGGRDDNSKLLIVVGPGEIGDTSASEGETGSEAKVKDSNPGNQA